jgi:selenocysteine lyase/cysteine desulfurase
VLGVICPVEALGEALRRKHPKVRFLVDAAQSAGVVPIDVEAAAIDLLAFPGHKGLFGPTGTGALLIGPRVETTELQTWREGGTGGDSTSPHQPLEMPHYLVGGTPNTVGIAGLIAGVRFLKQLGGEAVQRHEQSILSYILENLAGDQRFTIHGSRAVTQKVGVLSLTIRDRDTADVASILDQAFGICVRPGLHCAPYTHKALGTFPTGTIRLSPGYFNTLDEARQVVTALKEIAS